MWTIFRKSTRLVGVFQNPVVNCLPMLSPEVGTVVNILILRIAITFVVFGVIQNP